MLQKNAPRFDARGGNSLIVMFLIVLQYTPLQLVNWLQQWAARNIWPTSEPT